MSTTPPLTRQKIRDQRAREVPELELPPTDEEIKRALGWTLIDHERNGQPARDD